MHRPRRVPTWIAAFAVLLHLFAMPLMGAQMRAIGASGGHCPMVEASRHAGHGAHAAHADPIEHAASQHAAGEPAPDPSHHQGMPCCCAAGAGSLAVIPASSAVLHDPRLVSHGSLLPAATPPVSPRYRWPSLNPRASPFA
ncbi:DUF2946 family protein [Stutzerimonas marianensis]|uniref:DUF2946 family protein n=1 Tax=Stutzerimonas marianensis TaxID=2929513 RepID=UPI003C2AFDB2